jgi:hypothetical protein
MVIEDVQDPTNWMTNLYTLLQTEQGCHELLYRDMRKLGHYDDFLIIIRKRKPISYIKAFIDIKNFFVILRFRIILFRRFFRVRSVLKDFFKKL